VYGPEMTDLTLIDLPGYVKVGDKVQTGSIVDEINVLIQEFLHNERCIILAIV